MSKENTRRRISILLHILDDYNVLDAPTSHTSSIVGVTRKARRLHHTICGNRNFVPYYAYSMEIELHSCEKIRKIFAEVNV